MPFSWIDLVKKDEPFLALAPMEAVTEYVFRELLCDIGKPDVMFTEFTSAEALDSDGFERTIGRFDFSERQRPIIAQIWGITPKSFYNAAKIVKEKGFDGIDINMGCPDKAVMKKGSGACLSENPTLAAELIAAIKDAAPELPLSVKTRLGLKTNISETWIPFILKQNIAALTLHARTAKELSDVPAHWDEIKKAVGYRNEISPHTVLMGNGDVKSYKDALEKFQEFNPDGIMIGRGVFTDPYIFEKNANGSAHTEKEHLELLLKHAKSFSDHWNGERNFAEVKRFFKIYIRNFQGAASFRDQLMRATNYDEVEQLLLPLLNKF